MKKAGMILTVLIFIAGSVTGVLAQEKYPIKGEHPGGDITPRQAYEMMQKDPDHTFLVDVRTRYEYQDIGHPINAYNIPFLFYTTKVGKKGYEKTLNTNFAKDLLERFNPETDTLLMMCRSAKRTIFATRVAVEAGFQKEKVFNVLAGFEGDKIKDTNSPNYGKRMLAGWRFEGLPWTYSMDEKLVYNGDIGEAKVAYGGSPPSITKK